MHPLQANVLAEGPLVDVLIGLAAADIQGLRAAGRNVPVPLSFRALLDTGADVSCADPQALTSLTPLGIVPARFVFANLPAAGGVTLAGAYALGLTIVHPSGNPRSHLVLRTQIMVELPLGKLGYQILIGRDVLDRCLLVYDGPNRAFTLAF